MATTTVSQLSTEPGTDSIWDEYLVITVAEDLATEADSRRYARAVASVNWKAFEDIRDGGAGYGFATPAALSSLRPAYRDALTTAGFTPLSIEVAGHVLART